MLASMIQKIQTVMHHQEIQKNLEWMDTLTNKDELELLKETTLRLAKINFETSKNVVRELDILLEIDQKTYREAKIITVKYLNALKNKNESEQNTYDTVYNYQRQLFLSYAKFLDFYMMQSKIVLRNEKINLALARMLSATFAMAKWRYFDDQPAPKGTWQTVCKVIKCAENLALMNTNLFLYEYQKKETSVAGLLKQGFMLATLLKGNYTRLQIQLTEQVLSIWSSNPVLVNKFKRDKHHFCIDMDNDRGPERVRTVEKFTEYRFWRVSRLIDLIEAYLCAANTDKALAEFGLEKMASSESLTNLFKKLRVDWCAEGYERQRRKETRFKKNKLIYVTYGLSNICRLLGDAQASLFEEPAEKDNLAFEIKLASYRNRASLSQGFQTNRAEAGSENWWLVDESANGIGVELGKTYSSWIEAGKLIAYTSPQNKKEVVIAEIKSVRKQANGNYRAGLETICTQGTSIKVARLNLQTSEQVVDGYIVDDTYAADDSDSFAGLLLEQVEQTEQMNLAHAKSVPLSLIVPRSEFKRGNKLTIKTSAGEKRVEMGMPLMKQRDWVRVAISV